MCANTAVADGSSGREQGTIISSVPHTTERVHGLPGGRFGRDTSNTAAPDESAPRMWVMHVSSQDGSRSRGHL